MSRAASRDEFETDIDPTRAWPRARERLDQQFARARADPVGIDADRGQSARQGTRDRQIAEAADGEASGHGDAPLEAGEQRARGGVVATEQERIEPMRQSQPVQGGALPMR